MSKATILHSIYQVENQINRLHGKLEINLEAIPEWRLEEEANKFKKYDLVERYERVQRTLAKATADKAIDKKATAYFTTPEGIAYKQETEENIQIRELAIKSSLRATTRQIEERIQLALGNHWRVSRYYQGYLILAILDPQRSTEEKPEYYFAQDIEIVFDNRPNFRGETEERFETNIGSCGSFALEGGSTIGERALYYVGIGKLLSDTILIDFLKTSMRYACELIDSLHTEIKFYQQELVNPTPAQV